ncbi:hypothetical protein AW15_12200 [Aeromonas sp. HZM]|nr:hypothetical protein AW15_12200 [Aeromonas sp. HZM]
MLEAGIEGDISHLVQRSECQPVRGPLQPQQLDVTPQRHAAVSGKLPMKVKGRKVRHGAEPLQRQVVVEMALDVLGHRLKASAVGLCLVVIHGLSSVLPTIGQRARAVLTDLALFASPRG